MSAHHVSTIKTITVELDDVTTCSRLGKFSTIYRFSDLAEFNGWIEKFQKEMEIRAHPNYNMY